MCFDQKSRHFMHVYEVELTFEYLQVIHSNFTLENLKALGNSN